jgi:hypothetical protein
LASKQIGFSPPRSKLSFQIYVSGDDLEECSMDEIIRIEGAVAWVSPALPGTLAAMGIKLSSRSNEMKRIYLQRRIGRF